MVRCDEFYEKWKRCGNFCEKHPRTADQIDQYLTLVEESKKTLGDDSASAMERISERALRPLIAEKNPEIRSDAIKKSASLKKKKEKKYGETSSKSRVTTAEVKRLISETKKEKTIQEGNGNSFKEQPNFNFDYEFTNLWNFSRCEPNFGIESYPGRMPAQIIINLLHFYTDENDLVIDPMVGGGTTIDVCKTMNRRCLAYDIEPCRSDILKNDITTGILTEEKAKLVILDPPYSIQKKGEYTSNKTDLSNFTVPEFYSVIDSIAKECKRVLLKDGYVAFIISSLKKENKVEDLAFKCYTTFTNNGFILKERIIVPYANPSSQTGYWVASARENKFMLRAYRDLMVFNQEGED